MEVKVNNKNICEEEDEENDIEGNGTERERGEDPDEEG